MLTKKAASRSRWRFLETVSGLIAGALSLGVSDARAIKTQIRHVVRDIEVDSITLSTPRKKRNVFLERKGHQYLLCNSKTTRPILELNHTGQIVWNLCDGNKSPLEISRILQQTYSVDPHEAYVDCLCFLAELNRKDLIQL